MVTVYTTPWCPECIVELKYLDQKGVLYTNVTVPDRQQDRDQVLRVSGQRTVPVVDIDGKIIVGFSRREIDAALESREKVTGGDALKR